MQAVEIESFIKAFETSQEKRSLAIDIFLDLVIFLQEKSKAISDQVAYQVFETPEHAAHSITVLPSNIENLTNTVKPTNWVVEINIYCSLNSFSEALVSNLKLTNFLINILESFAKKHQLTYNTDLESKDYDEIILTVTFERVLNNE